MAFKRTTGKGDSKYKYKTCVIGIDQSYSRTGISIAVSGKLKKVTSIDFKNVKTKTQKRFDLANKIEKVIKACLRKYDVDEIVIICERIRTYTAGDDLRPAVIKAASAMLAYIVDTAFKYNIEVWSVDTRAWKTAILGTSKPIFEPIEGVKNPQKFGSVRKVIELGFESSIYRCNNHAAKWSYDDDAADSACIALYGFVKYPKLVKEY